MRSLRLLEEDLPTPDGAVHALASYLRAHLGQPVSLALSERCSMSEVHGTVLRVSTTASSVVLRVAGEKLAVPLEDVTNVLL